MNRKTFFKKLGLGTAAIAVSPSILAKVDKPDGELYSIVDYNSIYGTESKKGSYPHYDGVIKQALMDSENARNTDLSCRCLYDDEEITMENYREYFIGKIKEISATIRRNGLK